MYMESFIYFITIDICTLLACLWFIIQILYRYNIYTVSKHCFSDIIEVISINSISTDYLYITIVYSSERNQSINGKKCGGRV